MQRNCGGGVLFGLIFSLLLAGCGSGDEGDTPVATPTGTAAGIWYGTSSTGRTVWGAVAEDGQYWFWESEVGNPTVQVGVFFGRAEIGDGTFVSSRAQDFGLKPGDDWYEHGPVSGTQVERSTLQGTFRGDQGSVVSFGLQYDAESNRTASLEQIAGVYPGKPYQSVPWTARLIVTATGELRVEGECHSIAYVTAMLMGCGVTGTVTPRTAENLYDVVIREHPYPSQPTIVREFAGIALFDRDNGTLYVLALPPFGTLTWPFFVYVGTKQP